MNHYTPTCHIPHGPRPVTLLGGPCCGLEGIDETDVTEESGQIGIYLTESGGVHYYARTAHPELWVYLHSDYSEQALPSARIAASLETEDAE
jgi:hypothetical protein